MENPTSRVLLQALQRARELMVPIVLASTTGNAASEILRLAAHGSPRLIVVTHDGPGAPARWRFDAAVRLKLIEARHSVLPDGKACLTRLAVWAAQTFGIRLLSRRLAALEELLGTGGQVCFKIIKRAADHRLIRQGDVVIAVTGKVSGADTALVFKITNSRPFRANLLEILSAPARDSSLS